MRNLDQLKKLIQGSAILGALISDGSIQVVYKAPPKVDEELLFRTWEVEILIVDADFADQARKALEQLGFETSATRDRITGSKDTPITSSEREEIRGAEKQAAKQEKETKRVLKEQATDSSIEELQQQIDDLKEDVDLMGLVRPKGQAGARGPAGAPGRDGRDGRDVVATNARLGDLQDVTSDEPRQGQIVMWQEASQSWELRYPPQSPQAVPAGGGGGGGNGGGNGGGGDNGGGGGIALTVQQRNRETLSAPPTNAVTNVSAISFDTDSGFVVEDLGNGTQEAFIKLNSTFNPWHVDGEETLDATGEEPVEFVAGDGISIRTDATKSPKQIIIEADGLIAMEDGDSEGGGGNGGGGGGCEDCVEEAPLDGGYYVRHMGVWVKTDNFDPSAPIDGGDLDSGVALNGPEIFDGGNFQTGVTLSTEDFVVDGGNFDASFLSIDIQLAQKDELIGQLQQQMAEVLARLTQLEA